jgi:toxin ParE1/3/4
MRSAGCRPQKGARDIRPGYLQIAVGSHVLFYRVGDGGKIDIVRILHRRMDVESRL